MRRELLGIVVAMKVGLLSGATVAFALPLGTEATGESGGIFATRIDATPQLGMPLDPSERSLKEGIVAPSTDASDPTFVRPVPIPSSAALFGGALIAVALIGVG